MDKPFRLDITKEQLEKNAAVLREWANNEIKPEDGGIVAGEGEPIIVSIPEPKIDYRSVLSRGSKIW